MATYVIDEGSIFEKVGTSYRIGGIRFVLTVGEIYCADGYITPDNCVDKSGNYITTTDVTEDEARGHLDWMASDFDARGCGVEGDIVIESLVAYTNKGPIYIPGTDTTAGLTVDEKTEQVSVSSVVDVINEIVEKSTATVVSTEAVTVEAVVK